MKNKEPFGGKIILLGGDFRQTLPIQEKSTRSEIVDLSNKTYFYSIQNSISNIIAIYR